MKLLRKRKLAKQYGICFKTKRRKQDVYWSFKSKNRSIGFYNGNEATFLNAIKNENQWLNPFFNIKVR